jgi:hypothetical protein
MNSKYRIGVAVLGMAALSALKGRQGRRQGGDDSGQKAMSCALLNRPLP